MGWVYHIGKGMRTGFLPRLAEGLLGGRVHAGSLVYLGSDPKKGRQDEGLVHGLGTMPHLTVL